MQQWKANGWLQAHQTTPAQIADLFAIVDRDLEDSTRDLSPDWQFGIAYNAALKLCTILLYTSGYRPEKNLAHYRTLAALPLILFQLTDDDLAHFADIPFLNGGLFECLDQSSTDNPGCDSSTPADKIVRATFKKRYLDGFSRNAKKRPHVPDRLFFDSGETADLSTAYGDNKRKAEPVTGLISILNRYKFTIIENTLIDQEIALDPELLGKVFENQFMGRCFWIATV